MHEPVLVKEVINLLNPTPGGIYVDCTLGYGGHTKALLKASSDIKIYAVDADREAIDLAKQRLSSEFSDLNGKINFIWSNFKQLGTIIPEKVDGILFDLGLSSTQVDTPERGFSHRFDSPLDMRFNRESGLPCFKVVEKLNVKDLEFILTEYGEEYLSRRIARCISEKKPKTTKELHDIIAQITPFQGRSRTLGRVFQALRIFINDELNSLTEGLAGATKLLKIGGRICIISYHSLEDRIVKQYFRNSEMLREITRRPIIPMEEEVSNNRRARSAKLRCAEKTDRTKGVYKKYDSRQKIEYKKDDRNYKSQHSGYRWKQEARDKRRIREASVIHTGQIISESQGENI